MKHTFDKRHVTMDEIQDAVIDILAASSDGNDLTHRELSIVELAVNRKLSPLGMIVFIDMYRSLVTDYAGA